MRYDSKQIDFDKDPLHAHIVRVYTVFFCLFGSLVKKSWVDPNSEGMIIPFGSSRWCWLSR